MLLSFFVFQEQSVSNISFDFAISKDQMTEKFSLMNLRVPTLLCQGESFPVYKCCQVSNFNAVATCTHTRRSSVYIHFVLTGSLVFTTTPKCCISTVANHCSLRLSQLLSHSDCLMVISPTQNYCNSSIL